jgi:hypothetical protein
MTCASGYCLLRLGSLYKPAFMNLDQFDHRHSYDFHGSREWSGLAGFLLAHSCSNRTSFKQFFITPQLEYNGPPNVLTPEQSHDTFKESICEYMYTIEDML